MRALPLTQAHAKANRKQSAEVYLMHYYEGLLSREHTEEMLITFGYEQAQARRMVNRMDRVKVPPRWAGLLRRSA